MDKEYFTSINDVSRELDLPAYTLRYWEKQFATVVRPVTGAGGRRYYRHETVERLKAIKELLYDRGMTIAGVKKLIHNGDFVESVSGKTIDIVAPKTTATPKMPETTGDDDPKSNLFDAVQTVVPKSLNKTKLDLAIGLLAEARELLE